MNRILRRTGWRVYQTVHTTGSIADFVYWAAFHWARFRRGIHYWRVAHDPVTAEELRGHVRLTPAFSWLHTGLTNICNAKCSFCAYPKVVANKTIPLGVMPFDIFKRAVDEWAGAGGQRLDLTAVVGDPLVDPGLLEKVDYAIHRAGITNVTLTTNGILLNRNDTYKRLIDLGIGCVYISTAGTTKEVYEKVYGVKQYDEMLSGVHNLLKYNRERGEPADVVIRFRNAQKPSEIVRSPDFITYIKPYLSEKVRFNFTVDFDNWGGLIKNEDLTGSMRFRELPRKLDVPCGGLLSFAVRHDGSVRLCACRIKHTDMDGLVVGNIKEKSLAEIARSEETWNVIQGFYSGKRPEICQGCTVYSPITRDFLKLRAGTTSYVGLGQFTPVLKPQPQQLTAANPS